MTATYDYFFHNWVTACRVETRFRTEIVPSREDGTEERVAIAERPFRAVSLRWTGLDEAQQSRIVHALWRATGQRTYVPIYPDQQRTSASSPAAGSTINVPTASSRFAIGSEVLIVSRDGETRERKTVQTFDANTITTTSALANTYAAGSFVFPMILAELLPSSDHSATTRAVGKVDATFAEAFSGDAIPASADTDEPGALGVDTSDANEDAPEAPVLNLSPNYVVPVSGQIQRTVDRTDLGLGSVFTARGPRGSFGWDFGYLAFTKAASSDLLEFFESRRGRLMPFYFVNPVIDWELSSIAVGHVDVTAVGNVEDLQDSLEYIAVVLNDGTVHIRKVSGVTSGGGNFAIAVAVNFPAISAGDVARVTPAHFCRFARDELTQDARTDKVSFWRVSIVEVLGEATAAELTVPTGTDYTDNCIPIAESCAGDWTLCIIGYMMDPRAISGDCPVCLIGFGSQQVTVDEDCIASINVPLAIQDPDGNGAGGCAGSQVNGLPITIQQTFNCEYIMVYAGDCDGGCRPMRVFAYMVPGHVDDANCACGGAIIPDADRHIDCSPSFEVDEAWFV